MIEKIKNPYIPEKFNGSLSGCCAKAPIEDNTDYVPRAWLTKYDELPVTEATVINNDQTGEYTPQGGCSDGTYIYRALVKDNALPTRLQKIEISSGRVVMEVENTSFTHANDICYCSKDGYLYILHANVTSICSRVDRNTLQEVNRFDIGGDSWGISYNEHDDVFVVGVTGATYLSVYSYDWTFIFRLKLQNNYSSFVKQSISCSPYYIFIGLDNRYGTVIGNEGGSRIMVYTWTGDFVKSYYIPIKEIEWLHVNFDRLNDNVASRGSIYVGTYEGRDENNIKSGRILLLPFDVYPGQTVPAGRTSDVSGGLNRLHRQQEGTNVKLFSGNVSSGSFKLNLLPNTTVDSFRYLVFFVYGSNYKTIQMLRTGTTFALRENNMSNNLTNTDLFERELQLELQADNKTFNITHSICQRLKFNTDGTISTLKEVDTFNTLSGLSIREIWGII